MRIRFGCRLDSRLYGIFHSIGNRKDRFWDVTKRNSNAQIFLIFELGTMCEQLCEAGCGDPQNAGGQFM